MSIQSLSIYQEGIKAGKEESAELVVELAQAKQTITDLAMIVRRLLTKPLTEKRKADVWDYLKRNGLEGGVLRADDNATTTA